VDLLQNNNHIQEPRCFDLKHFSALLHWNLAVKRVFKLSLDDLAFYFYFVSLLEGYSVKICHSLGKSFTWHYFYFVSLLEGYSAKICHLVGKVLLEPSVRSHAKSIFV
jgi:hypothetical protein